MRPNFLVIGAMKSGTTSLCKYLAAHPELFMCEPKEPGFFVEERNWSNGWEWYEDLFRSANGAKASGEGSTHYTKYPVYDRVAEKIACSLPDAKFVYIMREPVSRTVSHYWHVVHYGHETRTMLEAVKKDPQYVSFSRYLLQLEQYFRHFPREQFYFASFERLKKSPREVVQECYRFLGVDDQFVPEQIGRVYNEGPAEMRKTRHLVHRLRWSPWWTRIAPIVPRGLKELGKRLEYTKAERPDVIPAEVMAYLRPIFAEDNARLFGAIGMRFDEWESSTAETTNGPPAE